MIEEISGFLERSFVDVDKQRRAVKVEVLELWRPKP